MRRTFALLGLAAVPALVQAQTPTMYEACVARGTWDQATCTCMQSVADRHMSDVDQTLAVRVVTRQTTIRQIVATQGAGRAEAFATAFNAFGTAARAQCGAP